MRYKRRILVPVFFVLTFPLFAQTVLHTIVIDPGHGGKDVGAQSSDGKIYEKDLALTFALRLKKNIEKQLNKKVILTRDRDIFISLEDRVRKANKAHADLFLSIHLNAAQRNGAKGVEIFFLSADPSDSDAKKLALIENRHIYDFEDKKNNKESHDHALEFILHDLAKNEYLSQSKYFAGLIEDELKKKMSAKDSRRLRQAPFYVLAGTFMPSILIELGFITNGDDLKKLQKNKVMDLYGNAIIDAIKSLDYYLVQKKVPAQ